MFRSASIVFEVSVQRLLVQCHTAFLAGFGYESGPLAA
jgi:hypothetical protein